MDNKTTDITLSPIKATASMVAQYAKTLLNDKRAQQFAASLSLLAKNQPKLANATPESLLAAMMACVHLDLMPNTPEGFAYIIPYENRRSGKTEAQFQVGYKGLVELAYRSANIKSISAELVFPEDEFEVVLGGERTLVHKLNAESLSRDRTRLEDAVAVYATAKLDNGETVFEVISMADIKKIRESSKARSTDSPWNTWGEAMSKKTGVKRLLKLLPSSTEDNRLRQAAEWDSLAEAGKLRYNQETGLGEGDKIKLPEQVSPEEPSRDVNDDIKPEMADENLVKQEATSIADKLAQEAGVE